MAIKDSDANKLATGSMQADSMFEELPEGSNDAWDMLSGQSDDGSLDAPATEDVPATIPAEEEVDIPEEDGAAAEEAPAAEETPEEESQTIETNPENEEESIALIAAALGLKSDELTKA